MERVSYITTGVLNGSRTCLPAYASDCWSAVAEFSRRVAGVSLVQMMLSFWQKFAGNRVHKLAQRTENIREQLGISDGSHIWLEILGA